MTHLQYERREVFASDEPHLGPIALALVPPDFTPPLEFDGWDFLRPLPKVDARDLLLDKLKEDWRHGVGMTG